ncbi:MAG: hypothetical protein D6769_01995 [Methanobacteriota archaeon]|nr:MAG: hypothetical protein D6769_01995 [Euryarchaeota archaeon]
MSKTLTIVEDDKVGLLMDISYIMGKEKINIENVSAVSVGGKAIFTITVKNPDKAYDILKKNGFHVLETDTLMIKIPDEPGSLSKITKLLSKEKINMTTLYVVSRDGKNTVIALTADKKRKAKKVLEPYLIEEQY